MQYRQNLKIYNPNELSLPILQLDIVSFGYPNSPIILSNVNLSAQLDSHIVVVDPNGTGNVFLIVINY
ncbi:43002_t:CDS:2, partial [Gigaspora margarita]